MDGDPAACDGAVTLHFAYGSNMSRRLMAIHAPEAKPLGVARLPHHRFTIMRSGYASVVPNPGSTAFGVQWQLTARDIAALNAYESLGSGLYRATRMTVQADCGRVSALVYIGGETGEGRPKPGYMALVIEAAREWNLPEPYIRSLQRFAPARLRGTRAPETGELR